MTIAGIGRYSHIGLVTLQGALTRVWEFSRAQPMGGVGLALVSFVVFLAIFGPLIAPKNPLDIDGSNLFGSPEWWKGSYLGTDHLGRDNLSRIMVGARSSISIAVISVVAGTIVGFMIGLVGGFYGSWSDAILQRLVEILIAIPTLVLALAIVSVLGPSQRNVIIAIALIQVPNTARVVRSVVLSTRVMEFVTASRAVGASNIRIMVRHVAPQTFAPLMVVFTAFLGLAIIIEASLSFLGLGTPPPQPAWGAMLAGKTLENVERAPWNAIFPDVE